MENKKDPIEKKIKEFFDNIDGTRVNITRTNRDSYLLLFNRNVVKVDYVSDSGPKIAIVTCNKDFITEYTEISGFKLVVGGTNMITTRNGNVSRGLLLLYDLITEKVIPVTKDTKMMILEHETIVPGSAKNLNDRIKSVMRANKLEKDKGK